MTDVFTYIKKSNDVGRPVNFYDSKKQLKVALLPDENMEKINNQKLEQMHSTKNPNSITLSNFQVLSCNIVNTERISTENANVNHVEGGWPVEIDITDENEKKKFIKKKLEKNAENQDKFTPMVKKMIDIVSEVIKMNNQIDMFEEYFEGEEMEYNMENVNVKTMKLFKNLGDQEKRAVTSIAWHPDGPFKLAASYSMMQFQPQKKNYDYRSFIWDITNPNVPCSIITPPSPIMKMEYNHRNVEQLAFGCYNGIVGMWDSRSSQKAVLLSEVENSHHEPVFDLKWMSSKGGNEFISVSTDGRVMWWDYRDLTKPTDTINLQEVVGATSLEYVADYGPKYLIGNELGSIIMVTKKPKKSAEINFNNSYGLKNNKRHLGPVYKIQRNPFNPRYFLSLGDWSVNLWEDELKTPIMNTQYHKSLLTDGCWSPSRPGVFFLTRKDGWLDIWDYYYRQNQVALSHKVSDYQLTCLALNKVTGISQLGQTNENQGRFCAVGDTQETITLIKLCDSLSIEQSDEKNVIKEIFDREKRRELSLKKQRLERSVRNQQEKENIEENIMEEEMVVLRFNNNLKQNFDKVKEIYKGEDEDLKIIKPKIIYKEENQEKQKEEKRVKDIVDNSNEVAINQETLLEREDQKFKSENDSQTNQSQNQQDEEESNESNKEEENNENSDKEQLKEINQQNEQKTDEDKNQEQQINKETVVDKQDVKQSNQNIKEIDNEQEPNQDEQENNKIEQQQSINNSQQQIKSDKEIQQSPQKQKIEQDIINEGKNENQKIETQNKDIDKNKIEVEQKPDEEKNKDNEDKNQNQEITESKNKIESEKQTKQFYQLLFQQYFQIQNEKIRLQKNRTNKPSSKNQGIINKISQKIKIKHKQSKIKQN